ncbi:MAG: S-layer homology domain-containing protein, partial [Clostridia bacterium]|nr:S-layer homology domain-containing protein [Clostridia bacterium]
LASGLVNGVDYENFGVGQSITRQQLCTIVYRAMNLMDIYLTPERTEVPFEDFDSVSPYAKEAVEALYKAGVINGVSETEFDAEGEATRAMAAKIVYEILERGQDK